jgi:hypothetical protein
MISRLCLRVLAAEARRQIDAGDPHDLATPIIEILNRAAGDPDFEPDTDAEPEPDEADADLEEMAEGCPWHPIPPF